MIRFAVVGTNWITKQFVDAAHETGKYKLTAIYSRSLEQAQAFASGEPIEITRRDGTSNVLISKAEYETFMNAKLDAEFDFIMQRHGRTVKALTDR